jgi:hypothetical protein
MHRSSGICKVLIFSLCIALLACKPQPSPPENVAVVTAPTSATAVSNQEMGSDEAQASQGQDLLNELASCNAEVFMRSQFDERRQTLANAKLSCTTSTRDAMKGIDCTLPNGTKSWQEYPAESVFIADDVDDRSIAIVLVQADTWDFRKAIEKKIRMDLTPLDDNGEASFTGGISGIDFFLKKRADGKTDLHCEMETVAAEEASDRTAHAGGPFPQDKIEDKHTVQPGSISGKIAYPADGVPTMRICAIHDNGAMVGCTQTNAGDTSYRIDNLAAADYYVVAEFREGDMQVGGHVEQIQCIRAPCEGRLTPVMVKAGAKLKNIDLNGFYESRQDFPDMPPENDD